MNAPIAPFAGAARESQILQAAMPADPVDAVPFDVTLGVALASGLAVQPPPVVMAPSEPLLELLLDGDWLPDEPPVPADDHQPAIGLPAKEAVTANGESMVLEKNLDTWLAAFGRRERSNRPSGDAESDPQAVQLDEPEVPESPDRLTTVLPSIGLDRLWPADTPAPLPVPSNAPEDLAWAGRQMSESDIAEIRPRQLFDARPLGQPMVEIGGFDFPNFPDRTEPAAAPASGPLADAATRWTEGPHLVPSDLGPVGLPAEWGATTPIVAAAALPSGAVDLVDMAAQVAPAEGTVAEVVSRSGADRVVRAERTASAKEPLMFGPDANGVARAVLHQAGADPRADSHGSDRRSREEPVGSDTDRRRPAVAAAAFDPGPASGRSPVVIEPAATGAPKADTPIVAVPNAADPISRRVDHLTLDLKDEAGDFGRLRVSVNGPQVRATIMPNDPAVADRLNLEIRQLKLSLQERGFPEPKITIQAPRAPEPAAAWAPVVRETVLDPAEAGQSNTQRRSGEDDRRDRWTAGRDQRRDEQRQQEQARQSRRDRSGDQR